MSTVKSIKPQMKIESEELGPWLGSFGGTLWEVFVIAYNLSRPKWVNRRNGKCKGPGQNLTWSNQEEQIFESKMTEEQGGREKMGD